jgi:hypothetical protein
VPKVLPGDVELDETELWATVGKPKMAQRKDGSWSARRARILIHNFTVERVALLCASCSLAMNAKIIKMFTEPSASPIVVAPEREINGKKKSESLTERSRAKNPSRVSPAITFGTDAMHQPGTHNRKWWD